MLELRAIGPQPDQRWRYRVDEDTVIRLGRSPQTGWAVAWDPRISREHADLMFEGNRMFVSCLEEARNPAHYLGRATRKFAVEPGGEFRIGATTFRLQRVAVPEVDAEPDPESVPLQRLQTQWASGDSRFLPPDQVEDNLRALLDFIDDDDEVELERTRAEQDTESTSQAGTATPDQLLRRIAEQQRIERETRQAAEELTRQHQREARALRAAIDQLRDQLQQHSGMRRNEPRRSESHEAAATQPPGSRPRASRAAAFSTEAEGLRRQLETLQRRWLDQIEAVQQAEAEANRIALQEARAAAHDDAREQTRLVADAAKQLEQQQALCRAEQQARQLAEQDGEPRQTRLKRRGPGPAGGSSGRRRDTRTRAGIRAGADDSFDPYETWLAIPPECQPPDHYRLLGLVRFEEDWEVIERSADRQMAYLRLHQLGQHAAQCQQLLNEVALAKVTLLDPEKKRLYDETLWLKLEELASRQEAPWPPTDEELDGTAFGEYLLLDHVAAGETGQLFLAQHKTLGRKVALNIVSEEMPHSDQALQRLRCKAQVLANCPHPNLVSVYDFGQRAEFHYLTMEYVDGDDLVERLRADGPLSVERAVRLTIQAADVLGYLHDQGIIHRNVCPRNLFVDHQDQLRLLGLGRVLQQSRKTPAASGELDSGNFDYLAPEQARLEPVDARTDIYGLGCTLFTALTAHVVFPIDNPSSKGVAGRTAPAPSLTRFRDDVGDALDTIFQRMVHYAPEQRYATMQELSAALEKFAT